MKILQIHNFYQQPGGEDTVFRAEYNLLTSHGDVVEQFSVHNDQIKEITRVQSALRTIWNGESYRAVRERIVRFRPDVVHCHNTFPLASPAVYYAAAKARVPVVQTVPNYRLICPAATLLRRGHICEECVGRALPWPGFVHACYRHDRAASGVVAAMLGLHRAAGTWRSKVKLYLSPTNFLKAKLVEGGFRPEQIAVKPNFLARDPGAGPGDGGYVLFAGRLAPEKGVNTLLSAWERLTHVPLKIAGGGPLSEHIAERSRHLPQIAMLGFQSTPNLLKLMKHAALLVAPSEWYEGFPMTIVESMACGTPVIAADIGSLQEVVEDGVVGARFSPGNGEDLARVVDRFWRSDELRKMRDPVRGRFLERYSAEVNYTQLREAYRAVLER